MTALGTILVSRYSLYVDYWGIALPGILAGIGTGLFFVPLTAVTFGNIARAQYDEASGVYALMRGIGGSASIAVVSCLFVRQTQIHWQELSAHITPFNQALVPYLAEHGLSPYSPLAAQRRSSPTRSPARPRCSPSMTCSGSSPSQRWPSFRCCFS